MPFQRSRPGLSLVEVMIASLVFTLAIVPVIGLLSTSQREVVKVQQRMLAVQLALSMVEEMRARPVTQRAAIPVTRPENLPQLAPLVALHRVKVPAAGVDAMLASFRCSAQLVPGVPPFAQAVRANVTWTEAGQPQTHSLEAQLDQP